MFVGRWRWSLEALSVLPWTPKCGKRLVLLAFPGTVGRCRRSSEFPLALHGTLKCEKRFVLLAFPMFFGRWWRGSGALLVLLRTLEREHRLVPLAAGLLLLPVPTIFADSKLLSLAVCRALRLLPSDPCPFSCGESCGGCGSAAQLLMQRWVLSLS